MNHPYEQSDATAPDTNWRRTSHAERCKIIGKAASVLSEDVDAWVRLLASDIRSDPVESITAEVLPTCAAWQWIGKHGVKTLRSRRLGWPGRPLWLWGVRHEVKRVPLGRVLILGTWNYPLFLTGAQAAASLAAGNVTWIKPAKGCVEVTERFVDALLSAGVPNDVVRVLPETVESATQAIDTGMDLVVMTGSAQTGRAVMKRCSETLTPTIIEASGCDAVVAMPNARQDTLAKLLRFGISLNSGATCIGPRRLLIQEDDWKQVAPKIRNLFRSLPEITVHSAARNAAAETIRAAILAGIDAVSSTPFDFEALIAKGTMSPMLLEGVTQDMSIASSDVFAPVLSVILFRDMNHAAEIINQCPYRLAASVIGSQDMALRLANDLDVGTVIVNDIVVPTADPRVPFGGRGQSGFGVTRGPEGLLAMTASQTISVRKGRWMPHLRERTDADENLLSAVTQLDHANSISKNFAAIKRMIKRP